MSLHVLFVDDDPFLLQALKRCLIFSCPDWSPTFAPSGEAAIELFQRQPFDVVVSDMRMPGINGAELLEYVREHYPDTIRIILSGQSDLECAFQILGPAHQYLCKPCRVEELQAVLENALSLREHLQSDPIRQVISSIKTLPALPQNVARLSETLDSTTASAQDVGREVAKDVGITAKIMQMANSPLFGAGRPIVDLTECVTFLGFDVVRSLMFSCGIFSRFENAGLHENFARDLSAHSVNVGARAIAIAKQAQASKEIQNQSLLAGLLHDLGKLVLADQFPDLYSDLLRGLTSSKIPFCQLEQDVFNVTHADVGAYLLSLWGFPNSVVEAVAFHHQPNLANVRRFNPLVAVYFANELELHHDDSDGSETVSQIQKLCDSIGIEFSMEPCHGS